jgi:threonine dehydrogenase-like Zn-dependent dehydrogenase
VVEVRDIADPKFEDPHGRKINHAVILKIVSTNICGSDQHMVRGRTSAPAGPRLLWRVEALHEPFFLLVTRDVQKEFPGETRRADPIERGVE